MISNFLSDMIIIRFVKDPFRHILQRSFRQYNESQLLVGQGAYCVKDSVSALFSVAKLFNSNYFAGHLQMLVTVLLFYIYFFYWT